MHFAAKKNHCVTKLEIDVNYIAGFGSEFFKIRNEVELEISAVNEEKKVEMKAFSQVYKSVLLSKTGEESMVSLWVLCYFLNYHFGPHATHTLCAPLG